MLPANGLYGHIRNNTVKSALLMGGFVVLIAVFWWAICLLAVATIGATPGDSLSDVIAKASAVALRRWWTPLVFSSAWFVCAYAFHAHLIRIATGARPVERRQAPDLYNLVENLAMSAGLPVPRIEIMETTALNAYASGLGPQGAVVAVTRGLLNSLDRSELEAVLAHEISHIKNYDIRLMLVATVFAGGLTMLGDVVRQIALQPRAETADTGYRIWRMGKRRSGGNGGGGGSSGALVAIAIAIALLAMTYVLALLIKFSLSRTREYLADAGAVELTKNPGALVSALHKIAGHDAMPGLPNAVQAMMISSSLKGLLATHPPVQDRIAALQRYAGALELHAPPAANISAERPVAREEDGGRFGTAAAAFGTRAGVPGRLALAAAPRASDAPRTRPSAAANAPAAPNAPAASHSPVGRTPDLPRASFGRRQARILRVSNA